MIFSLPHSLPRGIIIAGNWKMNFGPKETETFLVALEKRSQTTLSTETREALKRGHLRACLLPPLISLEKAISLQKQISFPVQFAAQNAHWEREGAFTGEISGSMLQEIGVHSVLIGHSERRQFFGETNTTARLRTESLLQQGFQVILCLGENQVERETGKTEEVLTRQLLELIPDPRKGIASFLITRKLILAYEPIWAIGTGLTASPEQAEDAHLKIRNFLSQHVSQEASQLTPILYGGSVTPEKSRTLLSCSNVDGALIGGASLKVENFISFLNLGGELLKTKTHL